MQNIETLSRPNTKTNFLIGALPRPNIKTNTCKNKFLKTITNRSLVTNKSLDTPLKIPIAHGEGKYFADDLTLASLIENDQILFKYCDENGSVNTEANPNGSSLNIAGICNKDRNVFGMMPHPERASDIELSNQDGKIIFESILNSFS